jgi:hypothetical protein
MTLLITPAVLSSPAIQKRGGFAFVQRLGNRSTRALRGVDTAYLKTEALDGQIVVYTDRCRRWQVCMTGEESRRWHGSLD